MPDSTDLSGRTFTFQAAFNQQPVTAKASTDGTTIGFEMPDGTLLEIPVAGFGQLASTLMIAAHAQ